jgi:hypothetical protein
MKTITFSDTKRPILTFAAEHTELAADGDAFVIQASGEITFQDTPALEDLMHNNHACLLRVEEDATELMSGRFHATFLVLEQEMLVVRITVGE